MQKPQQLSPWGKLLLEPRAVAACTHGAAPAEGAAETSPRLQHPTGRCCHQERTLQELRGCARLTVRLICGMTHLPFSPSVHTLIRHPHRKALFVRLCHCSISCGLVTAPPALTGVTAAFPWAACTEPSAAWGCVKAQHISR